MAEGRETYETLNLECNDTGESVGSISSRWYIAQLERTKISDRLIMNDKDSG